MNRKVSFVAVLLLLFAGLILSFVSINSHQDHLNQARMLQSSNDSSKYCEILHHLGAALKQTPFNSQYLVNWASVRKLLGQTKCEEKYTTGSYQEALEMALVEHPNNPNVMFRSGEILLNENPKKSYALFQRVLELDQKIDVDTRNALFDLIRSPEELLELIPANLSMTNQLYNYWYETAPSKLIKFRPALSKKFEEALIKDLESFKNFELRPIQLEKRLKVLSSKNLDKKFTKTYSQAWSELYTQENIYEYAEVWHEISNLNLPPQKTSYILKDYQVLTSQFDWKISPRFIYFDNNKTSLGVALEQSKKINLILITGLKYNKDIDPESLRIYITSDLQTWKDQSDLFSFDQYKMSGQYVLILRPKTQQEIIGQYFKLHFDSHREDNTIHNQLKNLVRIY